MARAADAPALARAPRRSDVQMTQFVVNMNDQRPMRRARARARTAPRRVDALRCRVARSERFIIHVLDDRPLLVQPHVVDEIKARVARAKPARAAMP